MFKTLIFFGQIRKKIFLNRAPISANLIEKLSKFLLLNCNTSKEIDSIIHLRRVGLLALLDYNKKSTTK